jgi:hypothetical protein
MHGADVNYSEQTMLFTRKNYAIDFNWGLQITDTMHVHVGMIIFSSKQSLNITVEKWY